MELRYFLIPGNEHPRLYCRELIPDYAPPQRWSAWHAVETQVLTEPEDVEALLDNRLETQ